MNKLGMTVDAKVLHLVQVIQDMLSPAYRVRLAGGFLRDTFGGKSPTDIDIAIAPSHSMVRKLQGNDVHEDVMSRLWQKQEPEWYTPSAEIFTDYNYLRHQGVCGLIKGQSDKIDKEIDLIVYDQTFSNRELASSFDMNLNQIVMGANGVVFATDEFLEGFQHSQIQVINHNNPKREKIRLSRLLLKYPDFEVIT